MRTVTKTALANVRQNKGRNILSGIAIALTTLLIFVILSVGYASISVRFAAVDAYYPTWHIMYRGVSQENAEALKLHEDIESIGLRGDFGEVPDDDATILLLTMDKKAIELNKMELLEGHFPKEKKDIVVSQGILDELGIEAKVGDEITLPYQLYERGGLGYEEQDTFRICGLTKTSDGGSQNKAYAAMTSMEYMESKIPENEREYRVMFRFAAADKMTTDQIEKIGQDIAKDFGVKESDVVENSEYLMANYLDPAFVAGMAIVILVVVLAGVLTIYSIYYVSMIPKVQEYGKLKAMGATKKQIRQIVFREGMVVTAIAIPLGLILSSLLSKMIVQLMFGSMNVDNELTNLQLQLIKNGDVPVLRLWIYVLTVAVTLFTVWLSLVRPMHTACKISPIEAMRYGGEKKSRKKERKGYPELNISRLTRANLSRNKKRTAITTVTLGATGILFMVVATILNCASPKEIAKEDIESDYRIVVESQDGDKMNPDREWSKIQQNNPLNDALIEQIRNVEGVEDVKLKQVMDAEFPELVLDGEKWGGFVYGLDETYAKKMEAGIIKGKVTYEELKAGKKVIATKNLLHWFPDLKIGDSIRMVLNNGDEAVEREFEIAAVADYSHGFIYGDFVLPKCVLEELNQNNLNYYCEITVAEEKKTEAYKALHAIAGTSEYLKTNSYEEQLKTWDSSMELISICCYAFLIILGGIGIMNLVNTMINSIHTRRRELGMMQAIGLSEKQLLRMLQLEGMFYTAGTLLISVGVGSIAGYLTFLWAREDGMFNIKHFHYPTVQTVILAVTVLVIQILLTYMISKNFRRQSLIDRVRYSE